MRSVFKRAMSLFLAMALIAGMGVLVPNATAIETSKLTNGAIVEFGSYPQSKVTDEALIAALNKLELNWQYYEYYAGTDKDRPYALVDNSAARLDFMKYCDVEYNGEKYRAVLYEKFRPNHTIVYPLDDNSGSRYFFSLNTVYWYKYEPISWKVLDAENGIACATTALDAQPFNNYYCLYSSFDYYTTRDGHPANDYAYCSLRTWLNDDFYNTAFGESEKTEIATSAVETSGTITNDKVYLLSSDDIVNVDYGFMSDGAAADNARKIDGSEYALSQNLYCSASISGGRTDSLRTIFWYTRTAGSDTEKENLICTDNNGEITQTGPIDRCVGVVPAIQLKVNYTLTLDANGGKFDNGESAIKHTYKSGQSVSSPEIPHREGCAFVGWDISIPSVMPSNDIVAKAVWQGEKYSATFDANGGEFEDGSTGVKTIPTECSKAINTPAVTKTGYVLKGWSPAVPSEAPATDLNFSAVWEPAKNTRYTVSYYFMDVNGEYGDTPERSYLSGTTGTTVSERIRTYDGFKIDYNRSVLSGVIEPDGSLELKVYYERKQYSVTFYGNGGKVNGKDSHTVRYYHGAAVTAPSSIQRDGYAFAGWDPEIASVATKNAGYYAQWSANSYNVRYVVDGIEVHTDTFEFGAKTIPYSEIPQKTGYTFSGWVNDLPQTMPAYDIVRTASWQVNSYEARFFESIDSSDYESVLVNYGSEISAPKTAPTKVGYIFAGWSLDGETVLSNLGTMDNENGKSFYAVWTPASDVYYTVEIHIMTTEGNYESTSIVYNRTAGVSVSARYSVPTGFSLNKSKSILSGVVAADSSLVLKVYLDRNLYKFTTVVDGETSSVEYLYGAVVSEPNEPVKQGYKFVGWDKEIPSTMPASDISVSAVFEKSYLCPDCGNEFVGEDVINDHIAMESARKATIKIKNNPGNKVIKYGETLKLTAETKNMQAGTEIVWYIDGLEAARGETIEISFENGTKTVEVKLVDSDGNTLKDKDGNDISDYQTVTVKSNLWLKIVAFFKKLFGKSPIIVQTLFR